MAEFPTGGQMDQSMWAILRMTKQKDTASPVLKMAECQWENVPMTVGMAMEQ